MLQARIIFFWGSIYSVLYGCVDQDITISRFTVRLGRGSIFEMLDIALVQSLEQCVRRNKPKKKQPVQTIMKSQ